MRFRSTSLAVGLSAGFLPWIALAATGNTSNEGIIVSFISGCDFATGNLTAACIPRFIAHIVQFIFMLIGIFFLMNIMFGGYQIILASTQGSDRSKGMNRLIWSVVGFLVAALSFIIMDVVLTVVLGS